MDFTREPIIETVITPKEGCKLVVRSSKSSAQEEYFVDAVEVVSFGNSFFFRSLERPKSFLVPANDYEILEVREARMVLKNVGLDRSIKIGGGREGGGKPAKEAPFIEKVEAFAAVNEESLQDSAEGVLAEQRTEGRIDKKRDRRSRYRRRRGREEVALKEGETEVQTGEEGEKIELQAPLKQEGTEEGVVAQPLTTSSTILSSILPPPPTLISETIARYKDNALFKGAFFLKDEEKKQEDGQEGEGEEQPSEDKFEEDVNVALPQPEYGAFSLTEKEEEEIYRHRAASFSLEGEPTVTSFEEAPADSDDVKGNISNSNHSS